MMEANAPAMTGQANEILTSRLLKAPREMVFEVFTNPIHVKNWWGPNGFTNTISEMKVEPGGVWRFIMHGPDGTDYPNKIVFTEVKRPELLVYEHSGEGDMAHVGFHVVVTFEDAEGDTQLTLRSVFASVEERERVAREYGAVEGAVQNMARMAAYIDNLASREPGAELVEVPYHTIIIRTLNAPRELVFEAWTKAEHLAQWWGAKGSITEVKHLHVKPGGTFLYFMTAPNGTEMWARFMFKEIDAPGRMVFVSSFSDADGNMHRGPFFNGRWPMEIENELTLEEANGQTTMTLRARPVNATATEADLFLGELKGMNGGYGSTFDRLDEYLEQVRG